MTEKKRWGCLDAVSQLKQMAERRVVSERDAKVYLLGVRMILDSLSPADIFDIEEMRREFFHRGPKSE